MTLFRLTLLAALFASAGCLEIEVKVRDPLAAAPSEPPQRPGPVIPEQVTADNARDMAQALWDECDQEELEADRQLLITNPPSKR